MIETSTNLAGVLEIRQLENGVGELSGRFPYNSITRVNGRFEMFGSGAFKGTIRSEESEVNLLANHDYTQPLANRSSGSLELREVDDCFEFVAKLDLNDAPEWVLNTYNAVRKGLMKGVSPGFIVARNGEKREMRRSVRAVRVITEAVLKEISIVTAPAYDHTTAEARKIELMQEGRKHTSYVYGFDRYIHGLL